MFCECTRPATYTVWTDCEGTQYVCKYHVSEATCGICEAEILPYVG
jgi:hypothetical protein